MTKPPKLKLSTTETASTKTAFGLHDGAANEPGPGGVLPPGDPGVAVERGDRFAPGDKAEGAGPDTWFAGEGDR